MKSVVVEVCPPGNDHHDDFVVVLLLCCCCFVVVVVVVVVVIIVKHCPPVVLVEVSVEGFVVDGTFSPEKDSLRHILELCVEGCATCVLGGVKNVTNGQSDSKSRMYDK